MSKDFDDLPSLSLPPGWELVAENLKQLNLPKFSSPFTTEQVEYLNKVSKLMAASIASVPPEVIEGFQSYKDHFEKISQSLSISKNLGEKKTKKAEEIAQEIFDESSEDLNPVIQITEESVNTASELDWNKIKNLEPNEEIPEAEVQILREDPLFSLFFKKLKGITPDKITASDVFKWLAIIHMLLGLLNYLFSFADRFS